MALDGALEFSDAEWFFKVGNLADSHRLQFIWVTAHQNGPDAPLSCCNSDCVAASIRQANIHNREIIAG